MKYIINSDPDIEPMLSKDYYEFGVYIIEMQLHENKIKHTKRHVFLMRK